MSEEDIPSGLWLCHMCQMLQKQRASNTPRIMSNDDDTTQHEIQKLKDSRPSTPITSDGVINAAKVRLNQKRSLSRVSSSSENSLSSDRELKVKLVRVDDQCSNSNGVEIVDNIEINTPTPNDENYVKNGDEQKAASEDVAQIECNIQSGEESEFKKPCEEFIEIKESKESEESEESEESKQSKETEEEPPQTLDVDKTEEPQIEEIKTDNEPKEEVIEITNDNETPSEEKDDQNSDEIEEAATEESATVFKSPFDELIKAASILNPRQFELPRELTIFPRFPGDEKGEF